jgi:hypothetical protein
MGIYPPAATADYIRAMHAGLLEEAKGFLEEAMTSYRLASSVAAFDRMVPDSARYEIDLGLARTLRKSGDSADAAPLSCALHSHLRLLVQSGGDGSTGSPNEPSGAELFAV